MAVDYTKLFTIMGKPVDKVFDYYPIIATHVADQAAIEATLAAQAVTYLEGELPEIFDDFKNDVSGWVGQLIAYVETVLTDESLVTSQFAFGSSPSLQETLVRLIADMTANDKNVTASVGAVGSIVYATANALAGKVLVGTKLDGVSAPVGGGLISSAYAGLTSQMLPDSETLTLTCTNDSENGSARGGETFQITGTGATSDPYSPEGENIGSLGGVAVADLQVGSWGTNLSFDAWTANVPDGWTVTAGTPGTTFAEETADVLILGDTGALRLIGAPDIGAGGGLIGLKQILSPALLTRNKAYWVWLWARKKTDALSDPQVTLTVSYSGHSALAAVGITPTTTTWNLYGLQFVVPAEIDGDISVNLAATIDSSTEDPLIVDALGIAPCDYVAGVSVLVSGGPEKFLIGDKITVPLSNNNAGKWQTFFRKSWRVQLPTDATPTISDALIA